MKRTLAAAAAAMVGVTVVLAACGTGSTSSGSAPAARPSSPAPTSNAPAPAPALAVAASTLGPHLIDGHGRTVYVFSADQPGVSTCDGSCLTAWPIVPATGIPPDPPGASAALATLTRSDGSRQLTIDGRPAYTFTGDTADGATSGEGLAVGGGVFTAVAPSGAVIPAPIATPTPAPPPVAAPPPTHIQPPPPVVPPSVMAPPPSPRRTGSDGDADNRGGPDDGDGGV